MHFRSQSVSSISEEKMMIHYHVYSQDYRHEYQLLTTHLLEPRHRSVAAFPQLLDRTWSLSVLPPIQTFQYVRNGRPCEVKSFHWACLRMTYTLGKCCDHRGGAVIAQNFTLSWQQWRQHAVETIVACSRHTYNGAILCAHPVRGALHTWHRADRDVATQVSMTSNCMYALRSWFSSNGTQTAALL